MEEVQYISCFQLFLLKCSVHSSIKKSSDRWILFLVCDVFYHFWFVLWGIVMKMTLPEELQMTSKIIFTYNRNTLFYCRFYSVSAGILKCNVIPSDFCSFQYSSSWFFFQQSILFFAIWENRSCQSLKNRFSVWDLLPRVILEAEMYDDLLFLFQ